MRGEEKCNFVIYGLKAASCKLAKLRRLYGFVSQTMSYILWFVNLFCELQVTSYELQILFCKFNLKVARYFSQLQKHF